MSRLFRANFLAATLFLIAQATVYAQERPNLWWAVDFNSIFDNREGSQNYSLSKTYFQTQLAPEVGLTMDDGKHRVAGGVVWTQPIGCEWEGYRLSPTLYYRYSGESWQMSMGMFPRHQLIRPLPNYIWNDSTYYNQHNIRGALLQHTGSCGFFEALIDWRGMQTETQREAFNIIAQGEWHSAEGTFVAGGLAMMNHLARSKNAPDDQYVVDDFVANPWVGVELGYKVTALDSLAVRVGPLANLVRDRELGSGSWKCSTGFWLDASARWRIFSLKNTLYYSGRPLFPYYSTYGALLDQGEPMYASRYFNRTTLGATLLHTGFMRLTAALDFNLARDHFSFYQKLQLTVRF